MIEEGVIFKTGVEVGKDVEISTLENKCDIILLTGGATIRRELPISGCELNGVVQAMDFLKHQNEVVDNVSVPNKKLSAKGKNVLLIFPVLEMKHLQFLNGKQQDSHSNFVSQLNKIFNNERDLDYFIKEMKL